MKKLGGKIKISGRTIIIEESKIKKKLINHEVIFDRIEAGTYMIAGALIGKKVIINKIDPNIIKSEINILKKMGVKIKNNNNSITLQKNAKLKKINVTTKTISRISNRFTSPINGFNDTSKWIIKNIRKYF